jgi:hypothetical protein
VTVEELDHLPERETTLVITFCIPAVTRTG